SSFSRPEEKPTPDSEHSTWEEAEARCQEIVAEELQRRFEESGSWTLALKGYLDSRKVVRVESEGKAVAFFGDFARTWVAGRLEEDWPALLERIIITKPEVPRGWFRWLHHTFLSRYPTTPNLKLVEEWCAVGKQAALDPNRIDGLVAINVEAHAWEIGWLGLGPLAEQCWDNLSPGAKGLLLAGFSNREGVSDWILARLPETQLTPEGTLEIACNAVWNSDSPLFQAVMEKDQKILVQEVERFEPPGEGPSKESRWSKEVARLSNRVVDMTLEACVLRGWAKGARVALQFGAKADLSVWILERSFNEHHSALSYAIKENNTQLVTVLLDAGAQPSGEMGSMPLNLAISNGNDSLAARLIEDGMDFNHGDKSDWLEAARPGDNIEWENAMHFNCHRENIEKAQRLGKGLPLVHASEVAWFYRGDGQGGRYCTFLSHFLYHDDVERLQLYVGKGLPLRLTLPDLATMLSWGAYDCLCSMIREWNASPSVMWRIRRELPEFGTERRLWRVRPDAKRVGVLSDFDPGDQEPLELPDGGRLWVDLTGLAGGHDQPGPVTPGTLWVRKCHVAVRRRADRVVLRGVDQIWELQSEPTNDHQLRNLLPVVKEVDGVFLVTGLSMGEVRWQDYPAGGEEKDWIKQWTEGAAWERLRPRVIERLNAQRAAYQTAPKPVLEDEELEPFPTIFHPWLRREEDGFIRLDESAAGRFPKVIADYRAWEASARRHEREWSLDERFLAWPSWTEVPVDFRPWFEWDTMLQRPRPKSMRKANAYEKAMCRRALNWWNGWMIAGIREALT
ncbi:MAG: ankyrin repeat domain-containing protein, partial [Terrimicrobiaceae bacterium]